MLTDSIKNGVAVFKLDNGVTNAINLKLVSILVSSLRKAEKNPEINGIILTSANTKFFSIGFDIPNLFKLPKEEFQQFYSSFNDLCLELYNYPKPTLAAINGHAIAGGCILSLCCDYRYITKGRKLMGLNEIKLGVPIPYPAFCILKSLVGSTQTREITFLGEFYSPDSLKQIGLIDRICSEADLLNNSLEKLDMLNKNPLSAFNIIKQESHRDVHEKIVKYLKTHNDLFVERWYHPETRKLLKEAIKKF